MKVKLKKTHKDAKIPRYETAGASGFDLIAIEGAVIAPGETRLIDTGIAVEIPQGYEIQIRPRSGMSLNTKLRISNSPGSLDSDFRGSIKIILYNSSSVVTEDFKITKGQRIAQGVLCPIRIAEFEEVDELTPTKRGSGGFGSTGK